MSKKFDFSALERPFEADWPVSVNVPQDGGTTTIETFTARLRLIKDEALKAILETPGFTMQMLARAYFVGFGKDVDAEWSEELRDQMLATPYVRLALQSAYQDFSQGVAAKN